MPTESGQVEQIERKRRVEKMAARVKAATSTATTLSHRAINATVFTNITSAMFAMDAMLVQLQAQHQDAAAGRLR